MLPLISKYQKLEY